MPNCQNSSVGNTQTNQSNCPNNSNNNNNNNSKPVGGYKEVVIIGNGPSGLCLSYFLSGHWPYWNKNKVSDEYLQMRLEYCDNNLSLVEQDLEYLSDGLEGRSKNSVSLLYDKLKHPDADLGIDSPSCLTWQYDPLKEIDHVVIGKAPGAGGAWNDLDGSQLTISPSRWMELPDMSYTDWERQSKMLANMNAGLVFSSKTHNFSEDNSLLNANYIRKPSVSTNSSNSYDLKNYLRQLSTEEARASMHDVRNYYRDYAKQKNLDKYLLNNATVTSVRRICCSKLVCQTSNNESKIINANSSNTMATQASSSTSSSSSQNLWEVVGLIDKRDRKKASSLTHKGDLMEFRFICKHLVLACGATDLHNELHVKGENSRFILRSIRELEDKIKDDLARLQKDPLLIVGSGLSAADAILLAQKYRIKIIHVIRRSVADPNLVFTKLPQQIYPEYQRVYDQMLKHRYTTNNAKSNNNNNNDDDLLKDDSSFESSPLSSTSSSPSSSSPASNDEFIAKLRRPLSQNNLNTYLNDPSSPTMSTTSKSTPTTPINNDSLNKNYILYDEYQVKMFTSKRTCILTKINNPSNDHHHHHHQNQQQQQQQQQALAAQSLSINQINQSNCNNSNNCRHLQLQKQHHQLHQRQLKEFDEEMESSPSVSNTSCNNSNANSKCDESIQNENFNCFNKTNLNNEEKEIKISYACILIGFSPNLDFLPPYILNELAVKPNKLLNTKDNPILVNEFTHESARFKNLFAMGPLIGDNFVRFGTGGALAITSKIVDHIKNEQQRTCSSSSTCVTPTNPTISLSPFLTPSPVNKKQKDKSSIVVDDHLNAININNTIAFNS